MFLVMKSATVFNWEMADKDRDGLLKRKIMQEGEKQASKKIVEKINLKLICFLGKGSLCSGKTGET